MALSAAAIAAIEGAATSAASAASHIGGSYTSAKKSYKYSRKLAELQNNYNIAAFERSKDWAKDIAQNEVLWNKVALQRAGYSTANPEGVPYNAPSASAMDSPKVSQFSYPDLGTGFYNSVVSGLDTALKAAQIKNINADTANKTTTNEQLKLELQNYRDTYDERVATIKSQYANLTKENRKLDSEIDNLAEVTRGLEIDNNFKSETFDQNKQKIIQEVSILMKDNKIKEVEQKLAENGIVVGMNDIQSLVSVAEFGKTEHLVDVMGKLVADFCKELPVAIKSVMEGLWQGAKSLVGIK